MDKIYFLIFIAVLLFFLAIYSYSRPTTVSFERFCDSESTLCVSCPFFTASPLTSAIDMQAYIISQEEFAVLTTRQGLAFKKSLCKEYLRLVGPHFAWQSNADLDEIYNRGDIALKGSQSIAFTSSDLLLLDDYGDFVVFSKNFDNNQLKIYVETPQNSENLLKYARILGWSSLLAIIIVSISPKIGLDIFQHSNTSLPLLQILAITFSLLSSNDGPFFKLFGAVQAMYLAIIYLKMDANASNNKYYLIVWMVNCAVNQDIVTAGQLYLCFVIFKKIKQQKKKEKIIGIILLIGLVLRCLKIVLSLGLLTYISLAWSIIQLPIMLLILQTIPESSYDSTPVM